MSTIKIHQFHSGSAYGDAVTNSLFYTQKILQELGFDSNIYCEHVAEELKDQILHYSKYKTSNENILLLHHSMGHDLDKWILNLKDKIILVYHNITPHDFFPRESPFYHYSIKGREQLKMFKEISFASIGDSKLNVEELLQLGFEKEQSRVIPLLIDYDKVKNHNWNSQLFDENAQTYNILFVGRIAPNKGQHELIELFTIFKELYTLPSKLFLVGGTSDMAYEQELQALIVKNNLESSVQITGKVPYEDLYSYYRLADVFVCLSEHEGFGVPLIEAMIFDVPVVAYDSSNIKNTLNGSGVLFKEKNLQYMAGFVSLLSKNRALRREIIKTQRENLLGFQYNNIKYDLAEFLNTQNLTSIDLTTIQKIDTLNTHQIQIEGPFDSSYSLALLNREMAKALNHLTPNSVSLFSTEGLSDYTPNKTFLKQNKLYNQMWQKSEKAAVADVVLRNLYPPRVYDAKGLINLTNSYGWEESSFPQNYIQDFNKHLDALPVMSSYVQKVMYDNGLSIEAPVVGVGTDHILNTKPKKITLKTKKEFKFLHISSCFARKGVDVLLSAYGKTFSANDNVTLIIKTFPNPHNNVEELIKAEQNKNKSCPEIELINQDLEDAYIVDLYKKCDALVSPTRGEGYGLPMAEAMLFDMPVITTGFGGQCDFCTPETSWLIDYTFAKAKTHMNLFNSYWVEPSSVHLGELMHTLFSLPKEEIAKKTALAKQNILSLHKWEHCAKRVLQAVEEVKQKPIFENKKTKLGWISSYNSKCGIATYSKFLLDNLEKDTYDVTIFANKIGQHEILNQDEETNTKRVWTNAGEKDLTPLYNAIISANIETLVIQFNFGFFNLYALQELLLKLHEDNIKIYLTLHSTADVNKEDFKASLGWISDALGKMNGIFVHSIDDLNILKSFNLINNVTLFPHGVLKRSQDDKSVENIKNTFSLNSKKVIASYGFLLPHKGINDLILGFALLKEKHQNIHLLLVNSIYPNEESSDYAKLCKATIQKLNLQNDVTLLTDFLFDEASLAYLDCSDMIILPYKQTQESSSASVRYAIATSKPVICTPITIFSDVEEIVHFTEDVTAKALASKIDALLGSSDMLNSKNALQKAWIDEHDWQKLASRLSHILNSRP